MKTIKAAWQEKDGHPALVVQFPRMFPFQIEEIEQVASDLGFGVDGAGQQRALGSLSGIWSAPGPGAVISSFNAVVALRSALAELGYEIEFPEIAEEEWRVADEGRPVSRPVVHDDDENWKRKFDAGYRRLTAMIDMPDRRAQFFVKYVMKHGSIPAEHREQYSELTEKRLSELVSGVLKALWDEGSHIGREQLDTGDYEDLDDVLADVDRIIDAGNAETLKVIVATWLLEPVGAFRLSYPLSLSEPERLLVERLGTIFGFVIEGRTWVAPKGGENVVAWRKELAAAGIEVDFQDSTELVRATLKTLHMKSLDAGKVAPFEVDLSGFSEAEKSKIKQVAWFCRFGFDGNILSPPDMNESYLMFRNSMREAGFLIRIVHEDEE